MLNEEETSSILTDYFLLHLRQTVLLDLMPLKYGEVLGGRNIIRVEIMNIVDNVLNLI